MKYTDLKDKDLAELNSMLKQSKLLLFTARLLKRNKDRLWHLKEKFKA